MLAFLVAHGGVLLGGLATTALVSAAGIVLGGLIGLALAFGLGARNPALRALAGTYRSFWRGTPILVQLLMIFYLLPRLGLEVAPLTAAVAGLALNSAAFQGEIFRAGLAAVPLGQVEAARVLGIPRAATRLRIELPQMLRLVLPALVNEMVSIVKSSSLVSAIAVTELTRRSQQLAATTYQPLEAYACAGLLYLALNLVLTRGGLLLERRLARAGGAAA